MFFQESLSALSVWPQIPFWHLLETFLKSYKILYHFSSLRSLIDFTLSLNIWAYDVTHLFLCFLWNFLVQKPYITNKGWCPENNLIFNIVHSLNCRVPFSPDPKKDHSLIKHRHKLTFKDSDLILLGIIKPNYYSTGFTILCPKKNLKM